VVGVRRRQPHPPSDAVDVRVHREDAGFAAREQQHAVCRLRADTFHVQQRVADVVGVGVADELVETVLAAVLLADPSGEPNQRLGLLVVVS
jgi:hypothetical protein